MGVSCSHLFILYLSLPNVSPNPVQKGPKEPIPEEQELDFQGLEEEEEEPSEGLEEGGPEAGEPTGWGGVGRRGSALGQAGRGALTRLCPPAFRRRRLGRRAGVARCGGEHSGPCLKGSVSVQTRV